MHSYEKFISLLQSSDWKAYGTQKTVSISKMEVSGHPMGIIRGIGEFSINRIPSIWDYLSVVSSSGMRRVWDTLFDTTSIIERLDTYSILAHVKMKAQWPTAPRDFYTLTTVLTASKKILFFSSSVVDDKTPVSIGPYVRGHVDLAGWLIERTDHQTVRVTYVVQTDPKGWIPSSVLTAVSSQMPMLVESVAAFYDTHGSGVCAVRMQNGGDITMNEYDPEKKIWCGNMAFEGANGSFLLRIDRKRWGAKGIAIRCTIPINATLHYDASYGDCLILQVSAFNTVGRLSIQPGDHGSIQLNGETLPEPEKVIGDLAVEISAEKSNRLQGMTPIKEESMHNLLPDNTRSVDISTIANNPLIRYGEDAYQALLLLHQSMEGWELLSNGKQGGLTMHRKYFPGGPYSGIPMMRGSKIIEGFNAEEILAVVKSWSCRKMCKFSFNFFLFFLFF